MEQSFWQSNEKGEKARFLRRREIFSRSKTSASAGRRIELPFGSNRILLGSQLSGPSFLAKISEASHKSSLFLGVSEELLFAKISNVIANQTFPDLAFTKNSGFGILPKGRNNPAFAGSPRNLAFTRTPGNPAFAGSPGLKMEIEFEKRDKNKIIYQGGNKK